MTTTGSDELLDALAANVAALRAIGLDAADIEDQLDTLGALRGLSLVSHRNVVKTRLGEAAAIAAVVRDALRRLHRTAHGHATVHAAVAAAMFREDNETRNLTIAAARKKAQERSGVEDRRFRADREPKIFRLIAQALVELNHGHEQQVQGQALMFGGRADQSVALTWLRLFEQFYSPMQRHAYAIHIDLTTAVVQQRDAVETLDGYLNIVVVWLTAFTYYRDRFYSEFGSLWLAPTDEGEQNLVDSADDIEYHDPYPEEFASLLRVARAAAESDSSSEIEGALLTHGVLDDARVRLRRWFELCRCDPGHPRTDCEVHIVIAAGLRFYDAVDVEWAHIKSWYRLPANAADTRYLQRVKNFRSAATERPYLLSEGDGSHE